MKNKVILFHLFSLLLVFSSCSSEVEELIQHSDIKQDAVTVNMALSAHYQNEPAVANRTRGSIHFENQGGRPLITSKSDFSTRCYFRKKGASFVGYADIQWSELKDENGKVVMTMDPSKALTLYGTEDHTPQPGEEWYISGIAGYTSFDANNPYQADFARAADASLVGNHRANVPLLIGWTKINVPAKNAFKGSVEYKPQGVLIEVNIHNDGIVKQQSLEWYNQYGRTHQPVTTGVFVASNVMSSNGRYDFKADMRSGDPLEGSMPTWTFNERGDGTPEEYMVEGLDVADGNSDRIYLWGQLRSDVSNPSTTIVGEGFDLKTPDKRYFSIKQPLSNGSAYTANLHASRQSRLPIERFTETDMTDAYNMEWAHEKGTNKYCYIEDGSVRYYNWETFEDNISYVPSITQYTGIVPAQIGLVKFNASTGPSIVQEAIQQDLTATKSDFDSNSYYNDYENLTDKYSCTAVYQSMGNGIAYALKGMRGQDQLSVMTEYDATNYPVMPDNSRMYACRYQLKDGKLTVTLRFLGAGFRRRFADVAKEDFWNRNTAYDITHEFQANGYYVGNGSEDWQVDKGKVGFYASLGTSVYHRFDQGADNAHGALYFCEDHGLFVAPIYNIYNQGIIQYTSYQISAVVSRTVAGTRLFNGQR